MVGRQFDGSRGVQAIPRAILETLEQRRMLSASSLAVPLVTVTSAATGSSSPPSTAFTPAQLTSAYGINNIKLNGVTGNGAGQTIAIVTADDAPALVSSSASNFASSDLAIFDKQFGLPDPPSFIKMEDYENGSYPPADTGWSLEATLDVEWTHAVAPQAKIILLEAHDVTSDSLINWGVATAAGLNGVSVVSMSFGFKELTAESEFDPVFTTPSGHSGVTFVGSTGDTGEPGLYPAYSPNVLAVGGTTLNAPSGNYTSEAAFSNGGGGISKYEAKPSYQSSVTQSSTNRTIPDVSIVGDPNSGVAVYDSYNGGQPAWFKTAGTSVSAPLWAGLVAIANQGRAGAGLAPYDGRTGTLPKLYSLPASDFHDITSGGNGYTAGPGYDLVTGRGTPIANLLVPALAGVSSTGTTGSISGVVSKVSGGTTSPFSGVQIYLKNSSTLNISTYTSSSGSYSFTGLPAGTYYVSESLPSGYTQTAPSGSSITVNLSTGQNASGDNFTDTAVSTGPAALAGSVIGTSGSYQNDGNTIAKAFDGNLSTFFDGSSANGNWAGLNLGTTYAITSIKYAPRSGWASRMVGGIFQGSNSSTFSSGVTNLATITGTPVVGSLTTISVSSSSAFQYVRYLSPNGSYGDVAEIQFFGTASKSTATKLTGTVIGTSGSYQNGGNTISKAFDGNVTTFFDGPTANGNWAGLNLGSAKSITQISYAPRSGWDSRMVGGIFQASNSATFSSGVVNLYTISSTPADGVLTTVNVSVSGTYQYVRYLSPNGSYGDVAEINFYG
jgi:hypothetical protein